jgi:hypothetical protein
VDPDPDIYIYDKILILKKSFSAKYFLKELLHHFSELKSQKEVTIKVSVELK